MGALGLGLEVATMATITTMSTALVQMANSTQLLTALVQTGRTLTLPLPVLGLMVVAVVMGVDMEEGTAAVEEVKAGGVDGEGDSVADPAMEMATATVKDKPATDKVVKMALAMPSSHPNQRMFS